MCASDLLLRLLFPRERGERCSGGAGGGLLQRGRELTQERRSPEHCDGGLGGVERCEWCQWSEEDLEQIREVARRELFAW